MAKLESGKFYILAFGKGTQLIYVESISKTGKRAEIRRCEAWLTEGSWHMTTPSISVDDKRILREIEHLPLSVPDMNSELFYRQHAEYRSALSGLLETLRREERLAHSASRSAGDGVACSNRRNCGSNFHSFQCAIEEAKKAVYEPLRDAAWKRFHEADLEAKTRIVTDRQYRAVPR